MKNLDIYNGFVLRYDEAVKYLDDIAVEHTMAVMRATPVCYTVARDGSQLADEWETDWEQEITTGFAVHSYEENGMHYHTEFYPVITNTEGWTDNSEQVLAQIEHDYPPTEYQNNEW